MDRERVLGIATDLGSRTSHTAIMARSLSIPAVVGSARHAGNNSRPAMKSCSMATTASHLSTRRTGDALRITANSNQEKRGRARADRAARNEIDHARWPAHRPLGQHRAAGRRGRRSAATAPKASASTAPNFFTSIATTLPTEEEQYETYRQVAEHVAPHPLIIRTFDLGGDKLAQRGRS